jgi:hypothetical protein
MELKLRAKVGVIALAEACSRLAFWHINALE